MKVDYNINGLCSEDEQKLMPFSVFLSLSGQYFCSAVKKSISFFHKIFIPKFATDCKSLSVHNKMHVEPYILLFDQTIKCKFSWAICIISLTHIFKVLSWCGYVQSLITINVNKPCSACREWYFPPDIHVISSHSYMTCMAVECCIWLVVSCLWS